MAEERAHPPGGGRLETSILREALTRNDRARATYPPGELPRAIWIQRADLLRQLGEDGTAAEAEAVRTPVTWEHDRLWTARELIQKGRRAEAEPLLPRRPGRTRPTHSSRLTWGGCATRPDGTPRRPSTSD